MTGTNQTLYPDFSPGINEWEIRPVRYFLKQKSVPVGNAWDQTQLLSLTKLGVIDRDIDSGVGKYPASFEGYQLVDPGDLVFCLFDVEETPRTVGLVRNRGMITSAYTAYEVNRAAAEPRFLEYLFVSLDDAKQFRPFYSGLRNTIPKGTLAGTKVALPPVETQRAIADFLDDELQAIDRVIKAKLALLTQLQDWYVAYLCQAVTRGLNNTVAFESTSFEWCTQKPVHWREVPLFTLGGEVSIKNRGSKEDNLLSLSYGEIVKKDINTNEGLLPESFDTYQIIQPGDIVFRFTDLQNDKKSLRSALSREKGIITSAYLAFRVSGCSSEFLALQMRVWDLMKVFYAMGSGLRQSLKFSDVKRMPVLIPPREEQEQIVQAIQARHSKIRKLKERTENAIEILKERRSTLITAAVVGKIDIQGKN